MTSFGQKVTNVRISQEGKNIVVTYDLSGKKKLYDLKLKCIPDGKKLSGDLINQAPGTDKKIIWNADEDLQFKLSANPKRLRESSIDKSKLSADYYHYKRSKKYWMYSALASTAVGTFSFIQAESYYKKYQTATSEAGSLHQKVKLYDCITPAAFGIAGVCAFEFVLNSKKQEEAKRKALSFYPQPLNHGVGIGLAYNF